MKNDLKTTMRISVVEGIFAQFHSSLTGIGSSFVTKTAVLLQASPLQFSILSGITQLCQFFQLYAVFHNHDHPSRKKPCIMFAFWGRLLNIFLGLSFAFATIISPRTALYFFITLLFFSAAFQTISSNMWVAWMTALIPSKIRGRFFSRRMQIHMFSGFIFGYVLSFLIDLFEVPQNNWRYTILEKYNLQNIFSANYLVYGLSGVFIIGSIIGLYGLLILNKQTERPMRKISSDNFSVFEPLKNHNFRRLMYFGMWWMFAIGFGAAFWGPFMLKVLKFSLVQMQLYGMISALGMLISFRFWGKFIDHFGNKTAMKITVVIGSINPTFWLFFSETSYSLIWVEAFTSGVMWSGANLVTFNFVLSIAPRGKEQHWSALYSALGGLLMLSTILLSGILFPPALTVGTRYLYPEQVLFGLTALLRLSSEIPLYFVHEPKAIPLRRTMGIASEIALTKMLKFKDMVYKVLNI